MLRIRERNALERSVALRPRVTPGLPLHENSDDELWSLRSVALRPDLSIGLPLVDTFSEELKPCDGPSTAIFKSILWSEAAPFEGAASVSPRFTCQ